MSRVAVIGDVGGHADQLDDLLARLGARTSGGHLALPDDLIVVQVGDLVHKGPHSRRVLRAVDAFLRRQPGRWIQLLGNHESLYLDGAPAFTWPGQDTLDGEDAALLRRWWDRGLLHAAAAVHGRDGQDALITHAGLTQMFWWNHLRGTASAATAARRLNAMARRGEPALWRYGLMMGRPLTPDAGPIWAEAGHEVILPWTVLLEEEDVAPPFHQVFGHSCPYDWHTGRWRLPGDIRHYVSADERRRRVRALIGGKSLYAIDPGHGRRPAPAWEPLIIPGAAVTC
ncbi:metallophosphoesterase [Bailinhaonella thermotolerans]|uniref:Metallophosphoesterase n=1 Tax=Bailinhaonella thermotolerans TaxID=1070861 RepID=A0A3A4A623_9ACTN|nr:metallophosphoesterase [Bailinhaonella thermotolerans]RJL24015.1 metallophosphoesterase [Bailinhaonella thermotolerans]